MTPERMNTMIDALPRHVINLLTKNCPQNPAKTDTEVRYNAAKKYNEVCQSYYAYIYK